MECIGVTVPATDRHTVSVPIWTQLIDHRHSRTGYAFQWMARHVSETLESA